MYFMYVCLYVSVLDVRLYDLVMLNYVGVTCIGSGFDCEVLYGWLCARLDSIELFVSQPSNNTIASVLNQLKQIVQQGPDTGLKSLVSERISLLTDFYHLFPGYLHKSVDMKSLLFL